MRKFTLATLFVLASGSNAAAQLAIVNFAVDARREVRPISPYIYGVNQSLEGAYANLTFTRLGGNRWTAYNWTNNASNAGSDWQFENDNFLGGGARPGGALISRLENAAEHRASILITIPINGYVAADVNGGGDVRRSGLNYLRTRFRREFPRKGAPFTLHPSPVDEKVYQDEFVHWVTVRYPYSQRDPSRRIFFSLDNEPDLWPKTHLEVRPQPVTYAELADKTLEYARAIKEAAPGALIFGPANYGWMGYTRLQDAPDAAGRDFQEFYLQRMASAEKASGKRMLDVLDVHWYPEATGGGKRIITEDVSPAVVSARLQAPRSLWDTTYTEESWICRDYLHAPIALLPRLKDKIDRNYPQTRLSMSEYNFGGGNHISGAIVQADLLGIFGRHGVFAANEWPLRKHEEFIGGGFRMYRDFDRRGGVFGNISVFAETDDLAGSSIYASLDSADPERMVIVALNKTEHARDARLRLEHCPPCRRAEIYQLTSGSPEPTHAADLEVSAGGELSFLMPSMSVNTIQMSAGRK